MRTFIIVATIIWAVLAAGTYLGQQSEANVAVANQSAMGGRLVAADLRAAAK